MYDPTWVILGGLVGVLTLASFTTMVVWRVLDGDIHRPTHRRFVLIDLLLWVASTEMLLDLAIELTGDPTGRLLFGVLVTRGMIGAGAIGLLVTFPRMGSRPLKERRVADRRSPSNAEAQ